MGDVFFIHPLNDEMPVRKTQLIGAKMGGSAYPALPLELVCQLKQSRGFSTTADNGDPCRECWLESFGQIHLISSRLDWKAALPGLLRRPPGPYPRPTYTGVRRSVGPDHRFSSPSLLPALSAPVHARHL